MGRRRKVYLEQFDHPLWAAHGRKASNVGHGGMDYIEDHRLIDCLQRGPADRHERLRCRRPDGRLHLWERSNANRSRPIDVPDFTRGKWQSTQPLGIVRA